MYQYKVLRVVKVVDGDTVDLEIDLGFHTTIVERFRLAKINCPEKGQPGFIEASQRLKELLTSNYDIIATTGKDMEKFRRWLITIEVNGLNVNDQLVFEGFAKPYP